MYNPTTNIITLENTKNGYARWLLVFDEMVDYFKSIPEDCPFIFYPEDELGKYHPLGYWNEKMQRLLPSIKTAWNSACKRANISGYNFHETAGSNANAI